MIGGRGSSSATVLVGGIEKSFGAFIWFIIKFGAGFGISSCCKKKKNASTPQKLYLIRT